MKAAGTVLVAGSANLDFVVRASHVPAPGETVLGRDFATFPGGKGANQAVACARAGGAYTRMLLALGDDPYAAVLDKALAEAGVERHVIRAPDVASGTAFICLSDDAENAITVAPGANAALRPHHLPSLRGVRHLLLQLETPLDTVASFAHVARAAGVRVMLNAAPATALPAGLLDDVELLTFEADIHDQPRAKLFKARGLEALRLADNPPEGQAVAGGRQAALTEARVRLTRALELDARVGVIKEIERIDRELKKEIAAAAPSEGANG